MMSNELKPCPKCQSTDIGASQGKAYCYNCGIQTKEHINNDEAVGTWNTRTESTELEHLRKERDDAVKLLIEHRNFCGEVLLGYESTKLYPKVKELISNWKPKLNQ